MTNDDLWFAYKRWARRVYGERSDATWKHVETIFWAKGDKMATRWLSGRCENCGREQVNHIDETKCLFAPTDWKAVTP